MTDREKLEQTYEAVVDSMITGKGFTKCIINPYGGIEYSRIDPNSFYFKWHPSSRPCFDKPAGVAILHGETL